MTTNSRGYRPIRPAIAALMLAVLATFSFSAYAANAEAPAGGNTAAPSYQIYDSHVARAGQDVPGCVEQYKFDYSHVQRLNDCSAADTAPQSYRLYSSHVQWLNQ
jgi:hypothetical protein